VPYCIPYLICLIFNYCDIFCPNTHVQEYTTINLFWYRLMFQLIFLWWSHQRWPHKLKRKTWGVAQLIDTFKAHNITYIMLIS
jgi:hypothetical protein